MATTAPGFGTPAHARRLEEAGVDEARAGAHAGAVRGATTESGTAKTGVVAFPTARLRARAAGEGRCPRPDSNREGLATGGF